MSWGRLDPRIISHIVGSELACEHEGISEMKDLRRESSDRKESTSGVTWKWRASLVTSKLMKCNYRTNLVSKCRTRK